MKCKLKRGVAFPVFALVIACAAIRARCQQPCASSLRVEGLVMDPTGAVIPNAQVRASTGQSASSDAAGHYVLSCVPAGNVSLTVQANGFASSVTTAHGTAGETVHLNVQLTIANAEASVQVNADTDTLDTERGPGTTTLTADDVQRLPDDPDDLVQQLQLLASSSGGGIGNATIVVDGFQNGSSMPPKSSIASIRVNPDPVSPEYERPGADGGRIEITTKPGSDKYHGAIFYSDSDSSFNATDPYSTTATPAGKRRYGFEFGGPIVAKKAGFSLALEKRDINEFNIVNAITLDANENQIAQHATVTAPQSLWIASARADWQPVEKDIATLSYAANVNSLDNQGVGGLVLAEAGYSNYVAEYDLRFTNTWTFSPNALHATHIGYTWKRTQQTPNSTEPALQVAGYFTGGGATSQNLNNRERDLEIDDDLMLTHGKHTIKFGAQSLGLFLHDYDPDTFNGSYVFGGGSAPVLDANNSPTGATATITPIEQYRRALLSLPGGTPTTYQITTGTPLVPYAQWRLALYGEDAFKILPQLTLSGGLRYTMQTTPETFANFGPRLGLAWAFGKTSPWTLHLRSGLYNLPVIPSYAAQAYRLNGTRQQEIMVYSPDYAHPLTPIAGSISVRTQWQFTPRFEQIPVTESAIGIERDMPNHWHPSVWYSYYSAWGDARTVNINAPMVASSTGTPVDPTASLLAPRPGPANLNIFEYQNSTHNRGGIFWAGIENKGHKRWTLSLGWWNQDFHTDGTAPQSSYSDKGEESRVDWQSSGALAEVFFKFPFKIEFSDDTYWHYGLPYNITTGTDANGDGVFNDRPSYASTTGDGVYSTPFGLMTTNAVNGNVPRNLGTMPTIIHMYSNISRAFMLSTNQDHPRTLTLNARAANLLNHTNVTAVGTVVSSPASLGQGIAAEAARRVEVGARFAF